MRPLTLEQACAEIRRRGGETRITGKYETRQLEVIARDDKRGMVLLGVTGWRKYGKSLARRASIYYLAGREHRQVWAVRLRGQYGTVREALDAITPAAVRKLPSARVRRQGDVYLVRSDRPVVRGLELLPESHEWMPMSRALVHLEHGLLRVPRSWPGVRVVRQVVAGMGRRGNRRAYGD